MSESEKEILDSNTYQTIQKLTEYVSFVANLPFTTDKDKCKALEIADLIRQINNPATHKNWWVCIDIYGEAVQRKKISGNFYWRKWFVTFENGVLEIVAESNYFDDEDSVVSTEHFEYYGSVYFTENFTSTLVKLNRDINEFLDDATNYRNYLVETRMTVETDLDIW